MNKIKAEIIADSICNDNRITTFILTYPRCIHGELLTHRIFSRNSASSRAIPFEKMAQMVRTDPFIPLFWQKNHTGMQGTEYFTDNENEISHLKNAWLLARDNALNTALYLNRCFENEDGSIEGVTKQLTNRLLEPFMYHTSLVTATEFDNFFELRCPQYKINNKIFKSKKDARIYAQEEFGVIHPDTTIGWQKINQSQTEIHLQLLAEAMWDARNESIPSVLQPGEWHIPFGNDIKDNEALGAGRYIAEKNNDHTWGDQISIMNKVKIATARCARISYKNHEGKIDYKKDIELHDKLLENKHFSTFEHSARVMTEQELTQFQKVYPRIIDKKITNYFVDIQDGWCNNFKGFIQYRYLIENNII